MELHNSESLFSLSTGDLVTKRNLYDLVQYSKVENSPYWSGSCGIIGNTPQQGINWIGTLPKVRGVIVKTRPGSYDDDGWADETRMAYRYSFKARNGTISYVEKANEVLIKQPQHLYPVLLFTEHKNAWHFEGAFSVSQIETSYAMLHRGLSADTGNSAEQSEILYQEGGRKYVAHLMAERSREAVKVLKSVETWLCDICGDDFYERYGVKYIEAHHKVPIATYSSRYSVTLADFALLCPNCHKAVHIHMKLYDNDYSTIKTTLASKNIDGRVAPADCPQSRWATTRGGPG